MELGHRSLVLAVKFGTLMVFSEERERTLWYSWKIKERETGEQCNKREREGESEREREKEREMIQARKL